MEPIWLFRASPSIDNTECVLIDYHPRSSITRLVDGQLRVFIILSPKCTKITTFLQITSEPENILKRLQNNYNLFKNTYIPWLKADKIHVLSTSWLLSHETRKHIDNRWRKHVWINNKKSREFRNLPQRM